MGAKSHSRQYEDRLVKSFEDMMKNIISTETKFNGEMMKSTAAMTKWLSILSSQNKLSEDRIKVSNKDYKKSQEQLRVKEKLKKADEYLVNLRHKLNIEQEREHGQQVRRNIVLRANMDSFNDKFNMLKKSLSGGFGFQAAIDKTVVNMGKLTRNFQENKIASEKLKKATANEIAARKLANIAYISGDEADKKFAGDEWNIANRQLESAKDTAEEAEKKAAPTQGKAKPIFERLSKLGEFLNKKAVPIGLGVGAAGVIMSVIVKAFSASPLFAAMMKLMKFMVNLILMPIGTFFGALLRPILIMLLRKFIIPFYSTMMPKAISIGTAIGNFLSNPWENLRKAILGNEGDGGNGDDNKNGIDDYDEYLPEDYGQILPNADYLDETDRNWIQWWADRTKEWDDFWKTPRAYAEEQTGYFEDIPKEEPDAGMSKVDDQEPLDVEAEVYGGKRQPDGSILLPNGDIIIDGVKYENADKNSNILTSSSGNEHMSTWASSGHLLGEDEYKNPVTEKSEEIIKRHTLNPDLIAQEQNFKNAIDTGGVIAETVKEVVKTINPNTGLVSHITNAGANIAAANARNASAGHSISDEGRALLEAAGMTGGLTTAANGFDGMVNSPTMFLAGEAGAEHVKVTPSGQGGGSNITINIQNMNGSDNDLRKLKKTILEVIQESSANRGRL